MKKFTAYMHLDEVNGSFRPRRVMSLSLANFPVNEHINDCNLTTSNFGIEAIVHWL